MKQSHNDGSSSGADESALGGIHQSPYLRTQGSLPAQIDPKELYVGLPEPYGWTIMTEAATDDELLAALPEQFLQIKSGAELLELLK